MLKQGIKQIIRQIQYTNGKHIYADGSAKLEADSTGGDFTVKKYGF